MTNYYIDVGAGADNFDTIAMFTQRRTGFAVVALEPLQEIAGENVEVIRAAAWTRDGNADFYRGLPESGTLIQSKTSGRIDRHNPVEVPCVRFGRWLAHYSLNDYLVVKINIEGAEYEVLDQMCADGTIMWVDELYLSLHGMKVQKPLAADLALITRIEGAGLVLRGHDDKVFSVRPPFLWFSR